MQVTRTTVASPRLLKLFSPLWRWRLVQTCPEWAAWAVYNRHIIRIQRINNVDYTRTVLANTAAYISTRWGSVRCDHCIAQDLFRCPISYDVTYVNIMIMTIMLSVIIPLYILLLKRCLNSGPMAFRSKDDSLNNYIQPTVHLPVAVLRERGSGPRTSLLRSHLGIQHDQAQGLVRRSRCWGSCTTRPNAL